jgi:hypothetical protein
MRRLAALVLAFAVGLSMSARAVTQSDGERTSRMIEAIFDRHSDEPIDAFLARLRPAPLAEPTRGIPATLPEEGEVSPSRKDCEKPSIAQRALEHCVRTGAMTMSVIDVHSAFVGLCYRTVVLVRAKALALLSADELAAVAHEIGHDADWAPYLTALQRNDKRMRELELKADGPNVPTLEHLRIDRKHLVPAVEKMMRHNEWQDWSAGATQGTGDRSGSLKARVAFIHAVAKLEWADLPSTTGQTAVSSDPPCSACDDVVRRVLPLLPKAPVSVVVIDASRATKVLRDSLVGVEGFVTKGSQTVCLTKQGSTFTHALNGPGIWDYALAIIVWHEMAHLEGASEREAQAKEEALWLEFVTNEKVDANRGLAYLGLLRKRVPD